VEVNDRAVQVMRILGK